MHLSFSKYQATGNDFVMISDRNGTLQLTPKQCENLCDRKFGIGADGVIIIRNTEKADFEVIYYNPDGSQSLCGNGSRAAVKFAESLGLTRSSKTNFLGFDGLHEAEIIGDVVKLKLNDVKSVRDLEDGMFIDTGSPHLVRFVPDVKSADVFGKGKELRFSGLIEGGTNVNFVEVKEGNKLLVRTYERGVEQETLSCGTGVTACALAASFKDLSSPVTIETQGGTLTVSFLKKNKNEFTDIYLIGPAKHVFDGTINF